MKIAYLGPEGSYSHLAAEQFLATEQKTEKANPYERDECIPFRNFTEVFAAVATERVYAAAVPIENSIQGGVLKNLDLLWETEELYAVRELSLKVDHRLVYKEGVKRSEIGRVYSHRQALDQCSAFLAREMPFAALKETESTGFGLVRASEDASGKSAAIAGAHITRLPAGFVMSEECVSDEQNNRTQFLLVQKGADRIPVSSGKIFFTAACPHRPGSLVELLRIIGDRGVNMTRIESRPVKDKLGDYLFFVEAEGDIGSERIQKMLDEIKKNTLACKLLGAY